MTKKRTRRAVKFQRAITGASLAEIMAKRNQKPEVRKAQREQAIRWGPDSTPPEPRFTRNVSLDVKWQWLACWCQISELSTGALIVWCSKSKFLSSLTCEAHVAAVHTVTLSPYCDTVLNVRWNGELSVRFHSPITCYFCSLDSCLVLLVWNGSNLYHSGLQSCQGGQEGKADNQEALCRWC